MSDSRRRSSQLICIRPSFKLCPTDTLMVEAIIMYNKKFWPFWTTVFLLSTVFLNAYAAEDKVGVVLLHGKGGTPATPSVSEPASNLKRNGFMVVTPGMSYSK